MFLYQTECPVSSILRNFANTNQQIMDSIIIFITGHAAEFIIGAAFVLTIAALAAGQEAVRPFAPAFR